MRFNPLCLRNKLAGFIHRCFDFSFYFLCVMCKVEFRDIVYLMDCAHSHNVFSQIVSSRETLTASVTRIDINYTCAYVHRLVNRRGQFDCGYPSDSSIDLLYLRCIFYPCLAWAFFSRRRKCL